MKLFHGTSLQAYEAILSEGLTPRGTDARPASTHGIAGHADAVYLTDTYPLYYALAWSGGATGVIIEIEIPEAAATALVVDEDVLACLDLSSGRQQSAAERHQQAICDSNVSWRDSLELLGTCAHLGPLPAAWITRAAIIDFTRQPVLSMAGADIAINLLNFRFCAYDHRCMTAWVFGDPKPESDHPSAAVSFHNLPDFTPGYMREGRAGIAVVEKPASLAQGRSDVFKAGGA